MIDHASEMAAFVRVVDSNGFSAAAPALGLSPSAVSKLVTRLETRLGVRLLQRTTRALHLTEEGEAFYATARRLVGEIEALEAQISQRSDTPYGLLRVTTSLAFSTHQLAPVIGEFLQRYQQIQLELLPTDRVVDMIEEGVDVAVRIGRLSDTSFIARKIGEDVRLVCASPSYLARRRAPERPEDLARHTCIVSRDLPYLNRWSFRIDGQIREIEVGGRIAVTEGEAQMRLALQGLGIVRLTRLTVADAIKKGELVPLLDAFRAEGPVPIHAVYPHRRHLAPKVTAFIDFILEKFSPPPWEI
ncbi:MAG: LysR family transcriptional regulator [Reyranella sp.]|jgi:DNA-binding transcriptional LysR family regulator|uniref:LysR family transcriptional regulator n=1 Tax=Reyranella sp. TaxID=1929291 RepID=UPI000B33701D|nr:LysR family transcriptional regulator [Reyranella sp.]MBN9536411.1 LysR family transcriptional regulator [Alphaproteobacteria bacterium]MBR2816477.1 LysR family transcriptional regulator [Reyranella sp.]